MKKHLLCAILALTAGQLLASRDSDEQAAADQPHSYLVPARRDTIAFEPQSSFDDKELEHFALLGAMAPRVSSAPRPNVSSDKINQLQQSGALPPATK